jgi:hypothetical protein
MATHLRSGDFRRVRNPNAIALCSMCVQDTAMLKDKPHHHIHNFDQIASILAGRPMSDIAWVMNEAVRLAARAKKMRLMRLIYFQR